MILYFMLPTDGTIQWSYKKLKFIHVFRISYKLMSMLEEGGAQALRRTAGHDRWTFSFDLGWEAGQLGWSGVHVS